MNKQKEPPDLSIRIPPFSPEEEAVLRQRPSDDTKSTAEAKQLASGLPANELKKRADENEANRTENFRDHFEGLAICTLYMVWIVLIVIGAAWVYHLLAPPTWPRLPDEQVKQLQSVVTGGILAGIAGGHLKKRMS